MSVALRMMLVQSPILQDLSYALQRRDIKIYVPDSKASSGALEIACLAARSASGALQVCSEFST